MFIIFGNIKQAVNYIKRHPSKSYREGCGCCWNESGYKIDGNKVVHYQVSSYAGGVSAYATVIGRIKQRKGRGLVNPTATKA